MEAVCVRGDTRCEVNALAAALHSLHLYCTILTATLIHCCSRFATRKATTRRISWRWQNTRGIASLAVGAVWCFSAAAATLTPEQLMSLVAAVLSPFAWLAATWLHGTLWRRKSLPPILYLCLYWLLSAAISAAMMCYYFANTIDYLKVNVYLHALSFIFCMILAAIDGICFFDEVANGVKNDTNDTKESTINNTYKHFKAYFYSKITFFWVNKLLRKGLKTPLELEDLGELPVEECSERHYLKFKDIFDEIVANNSKEKKNVSMWKCYVRMIWPNFYIGGLLKLLGDLMGLVPPLGLSVIVQYIVTPSNIESSTSNLEITLVQFLSNGYIMIVIITISAIGQALLSQNSTHLVSVEGIRLKTALQSMIFDKCMRLAPWAASINTSEEKEPLLNVYDETPKQIYTGLLTNLVSQDTYNVMSCVWICHYLWAIPLKVTAILYLLYNKLGISAIIGCAASILFVTPLQFYIGKKISDNSKSISKTSDHRISKMTEILQGITVIKLYVWEDLFKEKILNLREVELKLLNKDSVYWGILTFTTQASTILVTIITFTVYYFIEDSRGLSADNVFAALALFSQLSIPLLVLPVTVLMVVQATISTKRIKDFLALPESLNTNEVQVETVRRKSDKFNDAFIDTKPVDSFRITANRLRKKKYNETVTKDYNSSDDERIATNDVQTKSIVKFKNVVCTWGGKVPMSLEIDDLEIYSGKLIMVVGPSGSGKSSLLSAILGEMNINSGDIIWNGPCSLSYAGQPPWLLESSVKDNIIMGNAWCQRRYASVLRSTGLKADLQILPEGDRTVLGSRGSPLSGGQRVRVCVARALYSHAQLLVLDEPLGALDAALARQVVARGLVTATRSGRTVLLATNRLELLHYADMIIVMEDCRVVSWGRAGEDNALRRWSQLAAEARTAAARAGVGPVGGTARERSRLVRVLSRAKLQHPMLNETPIGVSEATGAHLLAELPTCATVNWRRAIRPMQSTLIRQLSTPPPSSVHQLRCRRDIRRVVSADASDAALKREASLLRRLLSQRPHRTLSRWTPRPIRKLLSTNNSNNNSLRINDNDDDTNRVENGTIRKSPATDNEDISIDDADEIEEHVDTDQVNVRPWYVYSCACGWWGAMYWCAASGAQGLAVAADWWLAKWTTDQTTNNDKMWMGVCVYASLCAAGVAAAACAQTASARGGGAARRKLHQTLLCATLGAAPDHLDRTPLGALLHRFSADILVIDKKLPTTVCRWVQLALLCSAATLVNAVITPWSLMAVVPAFLSYLTLQNIYRRNARELQRLEASTAAPAVSLVTEVRAGAATVRAGRLQMRMRSEYLKRLDHNHNALLLLNTTNRWLGLSLDLIGAVSVCACLLAALASGRGAELAGLAGAYSLLLPTYLAHLAKCRADLDLHLSAVERVEIYSRVPQEDYRDHCTVPDSWPASGEIHLDQISVQHGPGTPPILNDITIAVKTGEKIAICGRSGCGKSSLILSCVGAASVCSGHLRISKEHVTNIPLRMLRHRLVVLPQEVALFSGTLRENLDPLAVHTDDEIWQCLRVVGLSDFVSAQPAGLESSVGGETCGWRGGRASRLCAARVALHAPRAAALLLDEPGAALDAPAERSMLAAISACAPNTTILTVAHRVSSIRNYDRVVIIERGRIVEQGAPAELLSDASSKFARIYAAATRDPHCSRKA